MIKIKLNELTGKAHKFGHHINTDYIIPGKYLMNVLDPDELAQHAMEGVDPDFHTYLNRGDFIVAGENFGCGSSREEAPQVIKHCGVGAVVAKSFARIFYRNAINIGLPVVKCDTDLIGEGDQLLIDLTQGLLKNETNHEELEVKSLPDAMVNILQDGGLVEHFKKHGTFAI